MSQVRLMPPPRRGAHPRTSTPARPPVPPPASGPGAGAPAAESLDARELRTVMEARHAERMRVRSVLLGVPSRRRLALAAAGCPALSGARTSQHLASTAATLQRVTQQFRVA
jgi:hypothetical protein